MTKAVFQPGTANDVAQGDKALRDARKLTREARNQEIGIFNTQYPLRLRPFEVRFLARRCPPNRWVIDLGKNDHLIKKPQDYYTIPNDENRLFIPEEFVPLFIEAGWQRQL